MFGATLATHPNIFSVNSGDSKIIELDKSRLNDVNYLNEYSIFENGMGFVKDKIEYLVYKEVHPKNFDPKRKGIVLLRDYKSLNKSIKSIYNKLHGIYIPLIRKNPYISFNEYQELINIGKQKNILTISTELFIINPDYWLQLIKKFLKLRSNFPSKQEIISKGCNCGEKFEIVETDILPTEKKKIIKKQEFYYCKKHKSILVGGGGFNPKNKLDTKKAVLFSNADIKEFNNKFNNNFIV